MNLRIAVIETLSARKFRRPIALLCAPLMVVAACTGGGGHSGPAPSGSGAGGGGPVVQLRPAKSPTGAQLAYGTSIGRIPGVTYQPDVVVIGGGASSIRAADGSGYIWTIDGSASGASSLHVGSVMVATTLASGRVLQVRNVAGGDRQVVLGPVALTDVIKDGHFATPAPVPITDPLAYTFPTDPTAQQIPDPAETLTTHSASESRLGSKGVAADVPLPNPPKIPTPKIPTLPHPPKIPTYPPDASETTGIKLPEPTHQPRPWTEGDFTLTPHCCSPIGVDLKYHGTDGRMTGDLGVDTGKPRLAADVSIGGSSLVKASLKLYDAADAYFDFDAATENVTGDKPTTLFRIPETFQIPLPPFSIEVSLSLSVSIQLAGQAVLYSHAKYALDGPLGVTFDGTPHFLHPKVKTVTSVSKSAGSLGVSVNAISLAFHGSLSIGFGIPGIHVGPFVAITTALAFDKDGSPPTSSLTEGCSDAKVVITGVFGIGYSIAEPVRKIINFFLKAVNIKPILKSSGGPRWPFTIWDPPLSQRCPARK
jgi:hypothetical protein